MSKITSLAMRAVNKVVRHTKWYNSYWQGAQKFWNISTFGLDIINLGSGAAVHAFDYSECDVKGMNWALAPQSLVHDYNILRNYFSYLREGAAVIITICPFSCLFSKYTKAANFKYYTFLHPATIIDFDDNERTRALTIKADPFKAMPMKCLALTGREVLSNIKHKLLPNKSKSDLKASADSMLDGWKKQFEIIDLATPLTKQHLEEQQSRRDTLDEIIEFCKERDLKPVVVIPPMHHTLTEQFPSEMIKNYVDTFLEGLDAHVLNYMKDAKFDGDENFDHALFLSKKGAKDFTKRVINDLNI